MKLLLTTIALLCSVLSFAQDGVFTTTYIQGEDSVVVSVNTELDIDVAEYQLELNGTLTLDSISCSTLPEYGLDQCNLYYQYVEGGDTPAQSYDQFKVKAYPEPNCIMRIYRFYITEDQIPLLIPSPNPEDPQDLNEAYDIDWCHFVPVGIEEHQKPQLIQNQLQVNYPGDIDVFSIDGRVVFSEANFQGQLNLEHLSGIYCVRFQRNGQVHTQKIYLQ